MTGYNNNIQAYKKAFASVDKINQVIMLYDTAIASMQQARQAIIDKKIEERFNKIAKTFKILTGLRDSLDHNSGGEVAAVLSDWYSGTAMRVLSVNQSQDLAMCDLCINHIKQMRDAWSEIEKQVKSTEGNSENAGEGSIAGALNNQTPSGGVEAISNDNDFFSVITKAAYGSYSGSTSGVSVNV